MIKDSTFLTSKETPRMEKQKLLTPDAQPASLITETKEDEAVAVAAAELAKKVCFVALTDGCQKMSE